MAVIIALPRRRALSAGNRADDGAGDAACPKLSGPTSVAQFVGLPVEPTRFAS